MESLDEKIDNKIIERLHIKAPTLSDNGRHVFDLLEQVQSTIKQLINKNLKDILFEQFTEASLTPQKSLKIYNYIFQTVSQCFVNLKKTVDGDEVEMEDILREKKYNVPIERIIRKPSDLFDK